jgi:hypothetical protein
MCGVLICGLKQGVFICARRIRCAVRLDLLRTANGRAMEGPIIDFPASLSTPPEGACCRAVGQIARASKPRPDSRDGPARAKFRR